MGPGDSRPVARSLKRVALSPSMHKYGNVFVPSGLSAEGATAAHAIGSDTGPYLRLEALRNDNPGRRPVRGAGARGWRAQLCRHAARPTEETTQAVPDPPQRHGP